MRQAKLTDKDMTVMKEQDSPKEQHQKSRFSVRDHLGNHRVEIQINLSEECIKDQIFKFVVDDYEVLLDGEQVKRILRWL